LGAFSAFVHMDAQQFCSVLDAFGVPINTIVLPLTGSLSSLEVVVLFMSNTVEFTTIPCFFSFVRCVRDLLSLCSLRGLCLSTVIQTKELVYPLRFHFPSRRRPAQIRCVRVPSFFYPPIFRSFSRLSTPSCSLSPPPCTSPRLSLFPGKRPYKEFFSLTRLRMISGWMTSSAFFSLFAGDSLTVAVRLSSVSFVPLFSFPLPCVDSYIPSPP